MLITNCVVSFGRVEQHPNHYLGSRRHDPYPTALGATRLRRVLYKSHVTNLVSLYSLWSQSFCIVVGLESIVFSLLDPPKRGFTLSGPFALDF